MQDVNVDRFGVCISHSYLHLVRRILNLKCNDVLHLKWLNKNAKDPHIAATVASKKMISSSDIVDSASKCLGSKPQEKNFPVDLPTESGVVAPQIPFAAAQKVTKNYFLLSPFVPTKFGTCSYC